LEQVLFEHSREPPLPGTRAFLQPSVILNLLNAVLYTVLHSAAQEAPTMMSTLDAGATKQNILVQNACTALRGQKRGSLAQ